jgi:plasmid stabilization system protein ParE
MQLVVRPKFYDDIVDESAWLVENAGAEIAHRWHEAVWQTLAELDKFPFLGRERRDLTPLGTRSWRVNQFARWLIFYTVRDDTLVFLRVRHGMMNLPALELGD